MAELEVYGADAVRAHSGTGSGTPNGDGSGGTACLQSDNPASTATASESPQPTLPHLHLPHFVPLQVHLFVEYFTAFFSLNENFNLNTLE